VWALVDEELAEHLTAHNTGDAKQWIFHLIETLKHEEFVKVLVVLWAIWTARRKAIHEGIFRSPLSIFNFVMNYLQELQIAMPVTVKKKVLPIPNRRSQRWTVLKDGCLKFNVDGAQAKVSKRGACAVVCRDDAGRFQGSSAVVMDGISDPPTLEALACLEALSLAQDIGARQVYVSSDCAGVINAIKAGSRIHYNSVIREIQAMMPSFDVILFTHKKGTVT
jgi:hypothetical protein